MKTENRDKRKMTLEGTTPETLKVAVTFMALIGYFITDHYFMAKEYYAETPPYLVILLSGVVGAGLVFAWLRWREPGGANHAAFAVFSALGVGLAAYSFIPRLNILMDQRGLHEYVYTMDSDYRWQPTNNMSLPTLHLYLKSSEWWQQYKPGDTYNFELRKGGLGIWQVDMSSIFQAQKQYYDCDGVISCITK